jgi:hypothetical protein
LTLLLATDAQAKKGRFRGIIQVCSLINCKVGAPRDRCKAHPWGSPTPQQLRYAAKSGVLA